MENLTFNSLIFSISLPKTKIETKKALFDSARTVTSSEIVHDSKITINNKEINIEKDNSYYIQIGVAKKFQVVVQVQKETALDNVNKIINEISKRLNDSKLIEEKSVVDLIMIVEYTLPEKCYPLSKLTSIDSIMGLTGSDYEMKARRLDISSEKRNNEKEGTIRISIRNDPKVCQLELGYYNTFQSNFPIDVSFNEYARLKKVSDDFCKKIGEEK